MKIKLLGRTYEVLFVDRDEIASDMRSDGCSGYYDTYDNIIKIDKGLSSVKLKEVLVHELTHAYLDRTGNVRGEYNEEDVCNIFASFYEELNRLVKKILK